MRQHVTIGPLTAVIRECWVQAENRRLSAEMPNWCNVPLIHAIVVESVEVEEKRRRQGLFRDFLEMVCADVRFEMVIVEGVQNPVLASALLRWGWECDPGVSDYYWMRKEEVTT